MLQTFGGIWKRLSWIIKVIQLREWNFALSLKAMESKEVKVNRVSENELIKVNIDKMEVTPMSFIVFQSGRI